MGGNENRDFPSPLGRPFAELTAPEAAEPLMRGEGEGFGRVCGKRFGKGPTRPASRRRAKRHPRAQGRVKRRVGQLGGADNFGAGAIETGSGFFHFFQFPFVQPDPVARPAEIQPNPVRGRERNFFQFVPATGTGIRGCFSFRSGGLGVRKVVGQLGDDRRFFLFKPQAPASNTELHAHVVEDHWAEFRGTFWTVHVASWVRLTPV